MLEANTILADKGYDADYIIQAAQSTGANAVIPPKKSCLVKRAYDKHLYKERNLVERLFNRLKN